MATTAPPTPGSGKGVFKRVLVGRAVASSGLEHTLLPKILALPVFSSDALSSVAYATEEILRVLLIASAGTVAMAMPIAIAIGALLIIVVSSYRQTVKAYPSGGGAYIVSKDNLGVLPGLIAAAALLTDYVLTVSVSVVAGVFAMISALPSLAPYKVELSLGFVLLITLANLRGVKEAGTLFAVPTYAFIVSIFALVAVGLGRCVFGGCPVATDLPLPSPELAAATGSVGLFVILHAFSSGSTALTGVEAISNGVPAFRRPQSKNASETLLIMGVISVTMFIGISYLATHVAGITVSDERSVVGQLANAVFGGGFLFYCVQFFTTAILVLAANTSYQDFPRLASILARDRFMPRQFSNRGDRLVFSNGVIVLGAFASLLILVFDADLNRLIQLYVVGVFTSFTLSQTGMVKHWLKEKHKGEAAAKGWQRSIVINAIGAAATFLVLIVVTYTKFIDGAWIVIAAMPVIVFTFYSIHRHYLSIMAQLRRGTVTPGDIGSNHVVLLVRDLGPSTAEALGYIRSFRPQDVHAVYPVVGGDRAPRDQGSVASVRRRRRPRPGTASDEGGRRPGGDARLPPDDPARAERLRDGDRPRGDPPVALRVPHPAKEPGAVEGRPVARAERGRDRRAGGRGGVGPDRGRRPAAHPAADGDPGVRLVGERRHDPRGELRPVDRRRRDQGDLLRPGSRTRRTVWRSNGSTGRLGIPLDIVEAPFRDLTGPMLEEVRRFTVATGHGGERGGPRVPGEASGGTTCCTTRTRSSSSASSSSKNARCCRACRSW